MSKSPKKTGVPVGKPAAKAQADRPIEQSNSKTITVAKKGVKYKGARASWYAALVAHDGQTNDVFVNACTKKPPHVTKSGKAEDPVGWLRFFVRIGVATLS
jgi:hypothetical protein